MTKHLNNRQRMIYGDFMSANSPIGHVALMKKYRVGERTIMYDISVLRKTIAKYDVKIKQKTNQGYYISSDEKLILSNIFIQDKRISADTTGTESDELVLFLLLSPSPISSREIIPYFHISQSRLSSLIRSANGRYNGVSFHSEKYSGYSVIGDEHDIRALSAELIYKNYAKQNHGQCNYEHMPEFIKKLIDKDVQVRIERALRWANSEYDLWMSNQLYWIFTAFCLVSIIRSSNDLDDGLSSIQDSNTNDETDYLNLFFEKAAINASDAVRNSHAKWLLENGIIILKNFDKDPRLSGAVDEMLAMIDDQLNYDIQQLRDDLLHHLHRFFKLRDAGVEIQKNPLAQHIISKYKKSYDLSKKMYSVLQDKYNIDFDADEASYLAIYIYKNIIKKDVRRKKAILVCATGRGFSNLLQARLKNVFTEIDIVRTMSPYQVMDIAPGEVDFVLSTVPLNTSAMHVILISPILSKHDIADIRSQIEYGEDWDYLPIDNVYKQSDEVFSFDENNFAMPTIDASQIGSYAVMTSTMVLRLLEVVSEFKQEYQMDQERMLGLVIHLLMAVERWFASAEELFDDAYIIYENIATAHPLIFSTVDNFFTDLELSLKINISISERIAVFHYII